MSRSLLALSASRVLGTGDLDKVALEHGQRAEGQVLALLEGLLQLAQSGDPCWGSLACLHALDVPKPVHGGRRKGGSSVTWRASQCPGVWPAQTPTSHKPWPFGLQRWPSSVVLGGGASPGPGHGPLWVVSPGLGEGPTRGGLCDLIGYSGLFLTALWGPQAPFSRNVAWSLEGWSGGIRGQLVKTHLRRSVQDIVSG